MVRELPAGLALGGNEDWDAGFGEVTGKPLLFHMNSILLQVPKPLTARP